MQLVFTQRVPYNRPAVKTVKNVQNVTYIVKDGDFHATTPVQEVEKRLLTKVLNKAEVTYGMIKTVQQHKSCCSGAK